MNTFVASLLKVERALAREKGAFALFAAFLREDGLGKWDLVISAPWVERDKEAALRLISARVQAALKPQQLLSVSRIALVEPTSPEVMAINREFRVERSPVEVWDRSFFGMAIRHAHILASARQDAVIPANPSPAGTMQRMRRKSARG